MEKRPFGLILCCVMYIVYIFKIISTFKLIINYSRTSSLFTFATRFLHALIRGYALHRLAESIESKKAKHKPLLPSVFSFSNLATNSMEIKIWNTYFRFSTHRLFIFKKYLLTKMRRIKNTNLLFWINENANKSILYYIVISNSCNAVSWKLPLDLTCIMHLHTST